MSTKQISVWGFLFAVVCIAGAMVYVRVPGSPATDPFGLQDIDPQTVKAITRITAADTSTLIREGDGWVLGHTSVSSPTITAFLDSLITAQVTRVAQNGRGVPAYGFVGVPTRMTIETARGDMYTLELGATVKHLGSSIYVSPPDAREVYLLEGTTMGAFAREDWHAWVAQTATST